ncbi:MAG: ABC transporter substrate-binding protein [Propionibacteriaceae bacterium]
MPKRFCRVIAVVIAIFVTSCTTRATTEPTISDTPSATATPRIFTVATTEPATAFDPAAAVDNPSHDMAYQFFQRLMTAPAGEQVLKPDAAEDCLFKTELVYECQIRSGLHFHDGAALTSSDVRFSILRVLRLGIDQTTVSALNSLERIETPSDQIVQFVLRWPDTHFGFALTSAACSIVNEEIYNPDVVRSSDQIPSGSGPYQLKEKDDAGLIVSAYDNYRGSDNPTITPIKISYVKDSAALEDAMNQGSVDYVWRGLSAAAIKRLQAQSTQHEDGASAKYRAVVTTGSRHQILRWNPTSPLRLDATLRTAIAGALQETRTLDSLLPPTVEGHVVSFSLGGTASMPPLVETRPRLTLSYADKAPDQAALAREIRDQIESKAGVSLQLTPNSSEADLVLLDLKAWVYTPKAWLSPYISAPPPGSASKIAELDKTWRTSSDKTARLIALTEIQKQSAADLVVLPLSHDDETSFLASGINLTDPRFGPGFQLSLSGLKKG